MAEHSDPETDAGTDADSGTGPDPAPARPLLSVVRGEPTPEQLVALLAVVASRGAGGSGADEPSAPASLWAAPQVRAPLSYGPGAWRASGLPGR